MNSEYILIEKELVQHLINKINKLEKQLQDLQPKQEQPMQNQITIDEYVKTLKVGGKNTNNK